MTQQNINLGNYPNDPSADTMYVAFPKIQSNFNELYGNYILSLASPPPIGGITPNAGHFSNLYSTGTNALAFNAFVVNTYTTSVTPPIYANMWMEGTCTSGQASAVNFLIGDDNLNTTNSGGPGGLNYLLIDGVPNSGATGSRTAISAGINLIHQTGNKAAGVNQAAVYYTGGVFAGSSQVEDGGTAGNVRGNAFGVNAIAGLGPNVVYWNSVVGQETDINIDVSSLCLYKIGTQIIGSGPSGVLEDSALVIGRGTGGNYSSTNPGWKLGLAFCAPNVVWPISSAGTMIGTQASSSGGAPSMACAYGVDFSAVTFSTAAFKSNGFLVDPSGNVTSGGSAVLTLVNAPANAVTITPSGSTFTYVATSRGSVIIQGGTVSQVVLVRNSTSIVTGATQGMFPVSNTDWIQVTYTGAPNMTFVPA